MVFLTRPHIILLPSTSSTSFTFPNKDEGRHGGEGIEEGQRISEEVLGSAPKTNGVHRRTNSLAVDKQSTMRSRVKGADGTKSRAIHNFTYGGGKCCVVRSACTLSRASGVSCIIAVRRVRRTAALRAPPTQELAAGNKHVIEAILAHRTSKNKQQSTLEHTAPWLDGTCSWEPAR